MQGVAVDKPGASAVVVDGLEKPEPADGQVLVKSIYTAMNPVYVLSDLITVKPATLITGLGTHSWPRLDFSLSTGPSFLVVMPQALSSRLAPKQLDRLDH